MTECEQLYGVSLHVCPTRKQNKAEMEHVSVDMEHYHFSPLTTQVLCCAVLSHVLWCSAPP